MIEPLRLDGDAPAGPPLPGREDYPDDTAWCARGCGRFATTEVPMASDVQLADGDALAAMPSGGAPTTLAELVCAPCADGVAVETTGSARTIELPAGGGVQRAATVSSDGVYRYSLSRVWPVDEQTGEPILPLVWIMLNPSTADAKIDDPTIRRCIGFTRAFGFRRMIVVNLFGLRATDPDELARHPDPVGELNDAMIEMVVETSGMVIAAWGAHKMATTRVERIREIAAAAGQRRLHCLGTTKAGAPRHPLYLPLTAQPEPW